MIKQYYTCNLQLLFKAQSKIVRVSYSLEMLWGHRGLVGLFINKFIRCQGLRVRIPLPSFPFEGCIVRGEKDEEEELERVKREERGRQRRHSNQERLREKAFGSN